MQKKLIALAVAGLMSAPAFAQSNVTVYGVVDMAYTNYSSSDTNLKSRSGLDDGHWAGSRVGFKGTEDLGNGLKAGFVYEFGVDADKAATIGSGRQTYLTLSGGFGTVAVGRQYTPQFNLLYEVDPFATGTVGNLVNSSAGIGTNGNLYSMGAFQSGIIRLDNLVAYVSPNFGGLTVTAGYTANGIGDEAETVKPAKSTNTKIYAISPVYTNGPLMVGLNYHVVSNDNLTAGTLGVTNADIKNTVWDLAGAYDFGVVKLSAAYGRSSLDIKTVAAEPVETQWMVGATVPVGAAGKVALSYARNSVDFDTAGVSDAKASKWALGYFHSLSKRTTIYTAYADINTNTNADGNFSVGGSATADYTKGFSLGVNHRF